MEDKEITLTVREADLLIRHLRECEMTTKDPFVAAGSDSWALLLKSRMNKIQMEDKELGNGKE